MGEGECYLSADCQHIPRRQPADFTRLPRKAASLSRHSWRPAHNPPHPVGGEGVGSTFLDVGGLWSSDEARAKDSPGVLAGVDGWRPPARRGLQERTDPPPGVTFLPRPDQQWTGRQSGKVRTGPPSESPWKTIARSGLLRRNGKTIKAPGEARPLRPLPAPPWKQAAKSHALNNLSLPLRGRVVAKRPGGEGSAPRAPRLSRPAPPTRLRLRLSHPPSTREGEPAPVFENRICRQASSTATATASPPPMHRLATPFRPPRA
jgi:hypothetical protein